MTNVARLEIQADSRQVRTAGRDLDRFTRTSKQTQNATQNLSRAFARLGISIGALAVLRSSIRTMVDFNQAMSAVSAVTGATGQQFEALRRQAREMGATTQFSATQAANALEFLGRAGFTSRQAIDSLESVLNLAAASGMELARAADIASNIMSGFAMNASEAGRMADVLAMGAASANTNVEQLGGAMSFVAPVAATLGISLEETTAAIGGLSNAGIQGQKAGTGLRRVLIQLLNPTKQAQQALAGYGLTLDQIDPTTRSFIDIVETLSAAQIAAKDSAVIFGAEGVSAFEALSSQLSNIRALNEQLENADGAALQQASERTNNLAGDLMDLSSAFQDLQLSVFDDEVDSSMRTFTQAATGLTRALSENVEIIDSLIRFAGILTTIKLAGWVLGAASAFQVLGARAAFLTGPAGLIAGLVTVLISAGKHFADATQEAKNFGDAIDTLSVTQMENELNVLRESLSRLQMTEMRDPEYFITDNHRKKVELLEQRIAELVAGLTKVRIGHEENADSQEKAIQATEENNNETEKQINLYEKLRAQYDDNFAAGIQYRDAVASIAEAQAKGNLTTAEFAQLVGMAKDAFTEATTEADKFEKQATDTAKDAAEEYSQLATQIEGAFANAFERIFATGKIGFSELADEVGSIFRSNIAQQIAGALPGIGESLGMTNSSGQIFGSSATNITGQLQDNEVGARVQIPLGARLTAGSAEAFAFSAAGQQAGLSFSAGQQAPAGMGQTPAGAGGGLTPQGQEFVAQGGQTSAAVGAGIGMIGGTIAGGGGPAASSMASTGATVGMMVGGPVGAVVGGILGGILGGGSDRRRLDAEQKQRIENMVAELEVTIENNRALTESERETMKAKRRLEELNMARNEENRELIETKQQLEDRLEILEQINRVNDERNNLERRYLSAIGDTTALRQMEIQATEAANRGLLRFVFQVEDQVRAVAQAEGAARNAFQILQEAVRAEREELDQMLGRPLQMVSQALDRLTSTSREAITLADRQAAIRTLEQARQLGVGSLPEEELARALDVVSQPSENLFTSFVDYQRDFGRARSLLQEIEETAGQQFRSETERLDAIIADGEKQLNALFGIETAVMTVEQAINNLSGSIRAAESARSSLSSLTANRPSFAPSPEPSAPPEPPPPSPDVGRLQRAGQIAARGPGTAEALSLSVADQVLLRDFGVSINDLSVFSHGSTMSRLRQQVRDAGGAPKFADGGMHTGGMRIVGERGPELEMTGASRIMSNSDTRDLLGSDDMIAELRELRGEVASLRSEQARSQYQLVKNSKRTKDTLEKFDIDGLPPERT